jgi:DNA polymerase III subunit epsilon
MREITLDTETTGLDPDAGHRIVEIGCVEMFGRIRTGKSFHRYLDPERDMPAEAERIHGLSADFLRGKPKFRDIAGELIEFLGDAPLVIHNAGFDMKFLNFELQRCGYAILPLDRAFDTVMVARQRYPGAPASLDALCKRFEIDLSARAYHGALLDAELLADVYLELMGGRQEGLVLETVSIETVTATASGYAIPQRRFLPSEEELAAHAAFIAALPDALWLKQSDG